jgi:hypothetical protein
MNLLKTIKNAFAKKTKFTARSIIKSYFNEEVGNHFIELFKKECPKKLNKKIDTDAQEGSILTNALSLNPSISDSMLFAICECECDGNENISWGDIDYYEKKAI